MFDITWRDLFLISLGKQLGKREVFPAFAYVYEQAQLPKGALLIQESELRELAETHDLIPKTMVEKAGESFLKLKKKTEQLEALEGQLEIEERRGNNWELANVRDVRTVDEADAILEQAGISEFRRSQFITSARRVQDKWKAKIEKRRVTFIRK